MRRFGRLSAVTVALVMGAVLAACGGSDDDDPASLLPRLAGTPLPTAPPIPPTPPVCDVESPLPLPPETPADIYLPASFDVAVIETTPNLKIAGYVTITDNPLGQLASQVLESELRQAMSQEWSFTLNERIDGRDYDMVSTDGREGSVNIGLVPACDRATLVYDLRWITPVAGN